MVPFFATSAKNGLITDASNAGELRLIEIVVVKAEVMELACSVTRIVRTLLFLRGNLLSRKPEFQSSARLE